MSVAALITCFNKKDTIISVVEACIQCSDIDLIHIYDDSSTDGSEELLKSLTLSSKVQIFFAKVNRGVSHARNYLFENTDADIYLLIDGDDVIIPHLKSMQIKEFKHNENLLISYSDYHRKFDKKSRHVIAGEFSTKRLEMCNFIPFSSMITRNKLFFKNIHYEDYLCWLDNFRGLSLRSVHYFKNPTYYYKSSGTRQSSNILRNIISNFSIKRIAKVSYMRIFIGTFVYIYNAVQKRII